MYSLESPRFHDKIRKFPLVFAFLSYRKNFKGTQKRVRINHGNRAIGVRAIAVRLYIILTHINPRFYIVELRFTGVYILFFLFLPKHIPRGDSNEYPQSMFLSRVWKISENSIWKLLVFGGEIFNIFEKVCFRNAFLFKVQIIDTRYLPDSSPSEQSKPEKVWYILVTSMWHVRSCLVL